MSSVALLFRRRRPGRRRRRRSARGVLGQVILYGTVVVLAVVFVAPVAWGFLASLRPISAGISGSIITHPLHWHNYARAWHYPTANFPHYLKNTVFLTTLATIPIVLTSACAGFGYFEPPGEQSILSIPETLAAALMYTIPPLVFFFLMQKKLARGIVTTGVKG